METANSERVKLEMNNCAFVNRIHSFSILNIEHIDIQEFLKDAFVLYKSELVRILNEHNNKVKTSSCLIVEFEKSVASKTATSEAEAQGRY